MCSKASISSFLSSSVGTIILYFVHLISLIGLSSYVCIKQKYIKKAEDATLQLNLFCGLIGSRTLNPYGTCFLNMRVCQFHHKLMALINKLWLMIPSVT